jgi:2-hydroxy-6-oxonona-2,4-dienedioate hydrolase
MTLARARTGPVTSMWKTIDGLHMHARVSEGAPVGSPTIILVHGMVVSSRYMEPLARHLAPYAHVYVPDLPGYGRSEWPDHILELPELADALIRWMDKVGIERPHMIGNSLGCEIIVDLAVRYPDRIERAVLQGPTTDPRRRPALKTLGAWMVHNFREPSGMTKIMALDYWHAGLRRVIRTFTMSLEDPLEAKLPHVRVPTLVVRGARDVIVTQAWAEEVTRLLPDGRLVVIPGVMHTINFYHPLELTRVVMPFLRESKRAAA